MLFIIKYYYFLHTIENVFMIFDVFSIHPYRIKNFRTELQSIFVFKRYQYEKKYETKEIGGKRA